MSRIKDLMRIDFDSIWTKDVDTQRYEDVYSVSMIDYVFSHEKVKDLTYLSIDYPTVSCLMQNIDICYHLAAACSSLNVPLTNATHNRFVRPAFVLNACSNHSLSLEWLNQRDYENWSTIALLNSKQKLYKMVDLLDVLNSLYNYVLHKPGLVQLDSFCKVREAFTKLIVECTATHIAFKDRYGQLVLESLDELAGSDRMAVYANLNNYFQAIVNCALEVAAYEA